MFFKGRFNTVGYKKIVFHLFVFYTFASFKYLEYVSEIRLKYSFYLRSSSRLKGTVRVLTTRNLVFLEIMFSAVLRSDRSTDYDRLKKRSFSSESHM